MRSDVQQVRRDALAWWIPMIGDAFVCLTTLALDSSRYGGAITVTREPVAWLDHPFARILPPALSSAVTSSARSPPRRAPVIERYAGVAWPGSPEQDTVVAVVSGDPAADPRQADAIGANARLT